MYAQPMYAPLLSVSRRTRSTPFTPRVEAAGVKAYTVYNHMLLPTMFRTFVDDYHHLKEHVQVWDVSCERQVEIAGPDAARLVQLMTPRDISKIVVGQCFYAPIVDAGGAMLNDPVGLKLADDRYWLSIADSDVLFFARGLATGMGLDVEAFEPDVCPLAVQGPKADDLAARVFGDAVRDIRFFRFAVLPFEGHPLIVARSGWSKQGGFEIYLDRAELAESLWDALFEAGADLNVGPGCPNLIERIEGGLLSFGNDMTAANNPLECGLDKYCHLDRDFECLGMEALRRVRDAGVARMIRGLKIDGVPVPGCTQAWPILVHGNQVGEVSSAAYSPAFDTNIAFAMIDRGHWEAGTAVTVEAVDGARSATVHELPFTG